jgi:trk system potassium uptake protein TrkA
MYAIIVGAGRIGTLIARWLLDAEQEITVIDRDPDRSAAIEDELGSVVVRGDATESRVLSEAGASRADVLIATGRRDDESLVICQMAAHLFGVGRVMAVVNVPEHVDLFNRLGVSESIDTTALLVDAFEERLGGLLVEDFGGV